MTWKLKSNRGSVTIMSGVSLFLSVVLVFSGVKVYQITSKGASIQEAADASALAAEAEVAKFYTLANTADAGVYAMNLTQVSLYGAAVVAACLGNIPTSVELVETATKVGKARNEYANTAKETLNALQLMLPVSAAAKAAELGAANADDDTSIICAAVLVPLEGEEIAVDTSSLDKAANDIEGGMHDVQELGDKLAELYGEIDEIKEEAYKLDCGNNPAYCLYERASSLSIISGAENLFYSSSETWDFNVAFKRSLAYFSNRMNIENPGSYADTREQARSYLRRDYFEYVDSKMKNCYSRGPAETELYDWPNLYHDVASFKQSERYTESIYPVANGKVHANSALPCALGATSYISCAAFDAGNYALCEVCEFSTENVAKVGSATTNTISGYEHYFDAISKLKEQFDEKQRELDEISAELNSKVNGVAEFLKEFLSEAKNARIKVAPPGKDGAVAVATVSHNSEATTLNNAFVNSTLEMGQGLAISGASLKVDEDESGLAMIFDRLKTEEEIDEDAIKAVAGEEEVTSTFLNELPLIGGVVNKVSKAASETIEDALESVGLDPPDLSAYKPAIVNTSEVVESDDGAFACALRKAKEYSNFGSDLWGAVEGIKVEIGDKSAGRWG